MTLKRTVKRREQRKRRKAERLSYKRSGHTFQSVDWLVREHLTALRDNLQMAAFYEKRFR